MDKDSDLPKLNNNELRRLLLLKDQELTKLCQQLNRQSKAIWTMKQMIDRRNEHQSEIQHWRETFGDDDPVSLYRKLDHYREDRNKFKKLYECSSEDNILLKKWSETKIQDLTTETKLLQSRISVLEQHLSVLSCDAIKETDEDVRSLPNEGDTSHLAAICEETKSCFTDEDLRSSLDLQYVDSKNNNNNNNNFTNFNNNNNNYDNNNTDNTNDSDSESSNKSSNKSININNNSNQFSKLVAIDSTSTDIPIPCAHSESDSSTDHAHENNATAIFNTEAIIACIKQHSKTSSLQTTSIAASNSATHHSLVSKDLKNSVGDSIIKDHTSVSGGDTSNNNNNNNNNNNSDNAHVTVIKNNQEKEMREKEMREKEMREKQEKHEKFEEEEEKSEDDNELLNKVDWDFLKKFTSSKNRPSENVSKLALNTNSPLNNLASSNNSSPPKNRASNKVATSSNNIASSNNNTTNNMTSSIHNNDGEGAEVVEDLNISQLISSTSLLLQRQKERFKNMQQTPAAPSWTST